MGKLTFFLGFLVILFVGIEANHDAVCFDSGVIFNHINRYMTYYDIKDEFSDCPIKRDDYSGKLKLNSLTIATTKEISPENQDSVHGFYYEYIEVEEVRITGNALISTWPNEVVGAKRFIISAGCTTLQRDMDVNYYDPLSLKLLENLETIRIDVHPELISKTAIYILLTVYENKPSVIEVTDVNLAQKIISVIASFGSTFYQKAIIKCIAHKIVVDVEERYMEVSGYGNITDTHLAEVDTNKFHRLALDCVNAESLAIQMKILRKMTSTVHLQLNAKYGEMEKMLYYLSTELPKIKFTHLVSITLHVLPGSNDDNDNIREYICTILSSIDTLRSISFIQDYRWKNVPMQQFSEMCPIGCRCIPREDSVTYSLD